MWDNFEPILAIMIVVNGVVKDNHNYGKPQVVVSFEKTAVATRPSDQVERSVLELYRRGTV